MEDEVLSSLQEAIELTHDCEAHWVKFQDLVVPSDDGPAWKGTVVTFRLAGCKQAATCYAWPDATKGERPHVVLHRGSVTDAASAVRYVIFRDSGK